MIEQIYTFFSVEMIYMWINLGVLPFWFILIVFPQSQITKVFIVSVFPMFVLSLVYIYLLYIAYVNGYDFLKNFKLYLGFGKISGLFDNQYFLILFWG